MIFDMVSISSKWGGPKKIKIKRLTIMIKSLCDQVWSWSKIQFLNEFLMQLFWLYQKSITWYLSSFLTLGILTTTWSSITIKGTRCSLYLSSHFTLSECYVIYGLFLYLICSLAFNFAIVANKKLLKYGRVMM